MRGINKAILIGNVGQDPDIRYSSTGTCIASFSLATNEAWTGKDGEKQQRTEWHKCVAFGKLGEICAEYLNKGKAVYVEGRIHYSKWEDKDGVKHNKTEITVSTMSLLGGSPGQEQGAGAPDGHDQRQEEDDIPF